MDILTDYIENNDIYMEIYIIGYKCQGESILIFLKDYEKIVWAGIIDSYRLNVNIAKEILEKNGFGDKKRKINFLCISHPDYDHIKNMIEIMESCVDKNTDILTPDFLDLYTEGESEEVKNIKNYFSEKFKEITEENVNKLFFNRKYGEPRLEHNFICRGRNINFKISSLLPTDAEVYNKRINNSQNKEKNLYSLFVIIELGATKAIFAGDCENSSLKFIDTAEIPDAIHCFKIPHHGSKTSDQVFNWEMQEKELDISVCTTRTMKNTTSEDILERYKVLFEKLYLTADLKSENNNEDYGIVKIKFGSNGNILGKPEFIKNAKCNCVKL